MSGPELLTEAEARDLLERYTEDGVIDELRERGLIAPEPVDPLLIEAREICSEAMGVDYSRETTGTRGALLATYTALKRGMELAPAASPLTRERLADAIVKVFGEGERGFGNVTPNNITALHTALTERPA